MVRNNVMGLLYYLIINIIVFSITTFIVDYLYKMKLTYLELIIEPPVFLIAICMFIVTGRFLLKNQGSNSKNIFSVCLITIIGIIIAIQDFIFSVRINPFGLYWAYTYPINSLLVDKIGVYWYGMERFLLNCLFTFIPSVFMWLGIQWRDNKIMRTLSIGIILISCSAILAGVVRIFHFWNTFDWYWCILELVLFGITIMSLSLLLLGFVLIFLRK